MLTRSGVSETAKQILCSKTPLDIIPRAYIPIPNHPTRGAFCRTLSNVGWRRRPLLRLVTAGPGGPGQPSAGITIGCPLRAGRARERRRPEARRIREAQKASPLVPPGSTAPGTKKPHGGAPDGDAPRKRRARRKAEASGCAVRRSTPSHSRSGGEGKAAKSGAVSRAETIPHARRIPTCKDPKLGVAANPTRARGNLASLSPCGRGWLARER